MSIERSFHFTKKQMEKFDAWRETKGEVYVGAAGGAYEFCFTPTGLGIIQIVKCADGTELDLTDWGHF